MIKASVLLGTALFAVLFSSLSEKEELHYLNCPTTEIDSLHIEDIVFLEEEEEIELGFDTAAYLPINFNAYEGMELNLEDIRFIEDEEEILLGFDTADYLPVGFNAHAHPEFNLGEITFIEEEEDIVLGFDTKNYLPKNFDASSK